MPAAAPPVLPASACRVARRCAATAAQPCRPARQAGHANTAALALAHGLSGIVDQVARVVRIDFVRLAVGQQQDPAWHVPAAAALRRQPRRGMAQRGAQPGRSAAAQCLQARGQRVVHRLAQGLDSAPVHRLAAVGAEGHHRAGHAQGLQGQRGGGGRRASRLQDGARRGRSRDAGAARASAWIPRCRCRCRCRWCCSSRSRPDGAAGRLGRRLRLVPRPLVGGHRVAGAAVHQRQARRGGKNVRRPAFAVGAGGRLAAVGQQAEGVETAAVGAGVVVSRHGGGSWSMRVRSRLATAACRSNGSGV